MRFLGLWLLTWFGLVAPLHATWLDAAGVDRIAREISLLKFPTTYEAALALLGPPETQAALLFRTDDAPTPAADGDTPFVTQVVLSHPAAPKGYFSLVVSGRAKAPTPTAERTVLRLQLRFAMPRGPVLGPLQCEGGYRQLALVPLLPPRPGDKDGLVFAGTVGKTTKGGTASAKPVYHWLDFAAVDRINHELVTLKFPLSFRTAMALLAPADHDHALPFSFGSRGGTVDVTRGERHMPITVHVTLTDRDSPEGYFTLEMTGDGVSPRTPKDEWTIHALKIRYLMPRGPAKGDGHTVGGHRQLVLLPEDSP